MKKILFILTCVFAFSHLSAESPQNTIKKFVEFDMSSSTTRGIEREQRLYSGQAGLNSRWFDCVAGIQNYEDVFDFTIAGTAWLPCVNWDFETARIVLGCGALYHFQRFRNVSSEHDYMFSSNFSYRSDSGFSITFWGGYCGKSTQIDALKEYVPFIHDHYPYAGIIIDKVFSNGFEIYFRHSTHDFYRYPVFCSPSYSLGAAINLESGLRFGGDASIRIIDGYTTAPYVDSLILRMTARFTF
ncbi:MAG: hypothetical protein IJ530_08420 [Treponema sp.]|uniref:hypothetical protein n=1 Tax=Treponema sp. TaxID=166 RepID=UPI0025D711C5|nr:hypothetical protein [Treponema sp.]MBQ8679776.1 hypothetical protein [Treponema sp.]